MPTWTILYSNAFWPLLLGLVLACWRWGDRVTLSAATILALGMGVGKIGQSSVPYQDVEPIIAIVDAGMLLGFLILSLKTARLWLLAMTALQVLATLGHIAKASGFDLTRLTYAILQGAGAYPHLILLSIGLMLAIQVRRSTGAHPVTG